MKDMFGVRSAARLGICGALAATFLIIGAAPAGAHGLAGEQPSNYASRVRSVTPEVSGLTVRVVDLGARVEVRNETNSDVVILGYSNEPYLRVGPEGVFENVRSPAVFLNRSATIVTSPPPSYNARATPVWKRIGSGRLARWHDHRVHWMGASQPPAVDAAPGRPHLVSLWQIGMQYHGGTVTAHGDLRWIPGPSPFPRLLLALGVAVVVFALGFTRGWGDAFAVVLVALAGFVILLVAGEWNATSGGAWIAFLSTVYSIIGAALALAAAAQLVRARRTPDDAVPIVLVAAVVLLLGSGLADIAALGHSQIPTTLALPLDRTLVALVLGGSLGVLVTAARKLRRPVVIAVAHPTSSTAQPIPPAGAPS